LRRADVWNGWEWINKIAGRVVRSKIDATCRGQADFWWRILVSSDFVKQVRRGEIVEVIHQICDEENVNYRALTAGSRIRRISRVRLKVAIELVDRYGISLAETA